MRVKIESLKVKDKEILHDINISFAKGITLLLGKSGSGKTTMLRRLVPSLSKIGTMKGTIIYKGTEIDKVKPGVIGYISQNPDNQIVCDKVWHELAFGLESLGEKESVIRNRVAEISTYLGIESWFNKEVNQLSGGQKQKLCLASILCMNPEVIIMDEPTSMLDPIASRDFWELVVRLRDEIGIDFIIAEHNTDYIYECADKVIVMDKGTLIDDIPDEFRSEIQKLSMSKTGLKLKTIQELRSVTKNCKIERNIKPIREKYLEVSSLRHMYGNRMGVNIPKLVIREGITCWIGPNGSGKTTTAKMLTGFFGKKLIKNSVLMPQDVITIFTKDNVREELECIGDIEDYMKGPLERLLDKHPLDISGGEQHIVAVCKTLLTESDVFIFDEPTKGMDSETTKVIEQIIKIGTEGKVCIIITHDLELVTRMAEEVVMMFNGDIASQGEPHEILCGNTMYKPIASRVWNDVIRGDEVICT